MPNLTNEQIENIRLELKQFLASHPDITDRDIAKNIDYSPAAVNTFKNGKYSGNLEKFAEAIGGFLANSRSAEAAVGTRGDLLFAMTIAARDIFKIATYALSEGKIGVVTGVPGCGKTCTVKEYKKRNATTILIEITPIINPSSLLQDICRALSIPIPAQINKSLLFNEIVEKLKGTKRLLIFDEAENLSLVTLEIIRRIQDFTGVGILLSGTSKLLDRLRGPKRELQQLYSRIGIQKEIKMLQIGDVKAILELNFKDAIPFANTFLSLSKQNGRVLQHLISLVKRTVYESGESLTDDLIDDCAGMLLR